MSPIDFPEKQQELIEVVKALGPVSEEQLAYCDDRCLARYLRARKGNVSKAAKLLRSTLDWRAGIDMNSLRLDEFSKELKSGKMYVYGNDAEGRSILVTRKRSDAFQAGEYDHYIRHLAFTLETACRNMQSGQEAWVWIMDLGGMTRANSPPINVSMATLNILADHFPERLHRCFMVDAPAYFSVLWTALYPFIDPVTKKKVAFISSAEWRKRMEALKQQKQQGEGGAQDTPAVALPSGPAADFVPYWQVYDTAYDESAYRKLLHTVGWK